MLQALEQSSAPFKLVANGGQILNSAAVYENFAQYPEERNYLLNEIENRNTKGVVFLTGDRHHSALSKMINAKENVIYDFTISPLTSKAYVPSEKNENLVEGTTVSTQNYGIIEVNGAAGRRLLTMRVHTADGKLVWQRTIEHP